MSLVRDNIYIVDIVKIIYIYECINMKCHVDPVYIYECIKLEMSCGPSFKRISDKKYLDAYLKLGNWLLWKTSLYFVEEFT